MKKIKIILNVLIVLSISFNSLSQDSYATYEYEISDKAYDIKISNKQEGKYSIYIDMYSFNKLYPIGGLIISDKNHLAFLLNLNEARTKYKEWKQTAIDNNVTELIKTMSFKSKVGGYFEYGSKWHFHLTLFASFDFIVNEHGTYLVLKITSLTSSSNQYIKHDGFLITFSNDSEIEHFSNILSLEKINEFNAKPDPTDLFKD